MERRFKKQKSIFLNDNKIKLGEWRECTRKDISQYERQNTKQIQSIRIKEIDKKKSFKQETVKNGREGGKEERVEGKHVIRKGGGGEIKG